MYQEIFVHTHSTKTAMTLRLFTTCKFIAQYKINHSCDIFIGLILLSLFRSRLPPTMSHLILSYVWLIILESSEMYEFLQRIGWKLIQNWFNHLSMESFVASKYAMKSGFFLNRITHFTIMLIFLFINWLINLRS